MTETWQEDDGSWCWLCEDCGTNGWDFATEARAEFVAAGHRRMIHREATHV